MATGLKRWPIERPLKCMRACNFRNRFLDHYTFQKEVGPENDFKKEMRQY